MKEQLLFFQRLKESVDSNIALAEEISTLLHLSIDAVYRRMRGETALTYDEAALIRKAFGLKTDNTQAEANNVVSFKYHSLYKSNKAFQQYLEGLIQDFKLIKQSNSVKLTYCALDIPVFHYFRSPKLAYFKLFYWQNSVMDIDQTDAYMTNRDKLADKIALVQNFYTLYQKTDSTEFWTDSTIDSFIHQLAYYWESGILDSFEELSLIVEEAKEMIKSIEKQASNGKKIALEHGEVSNTAKFDFYMSELLIGNNLILADMGKEKWSFISHQSFNSIRSSDKHFYAENEQWVKGLQKKSILLSTTGEKIRHQFFKRQIEKLNALILKYEKQ